MITDHTTPTTKLLRDFAHSQREVAHEGQHLPRGQRAAGWFLGGAAAAIFGGWLFLSATAPPATDAAALEAGAVLEPPVIICQEIKQT